MWHEADPQRRRALVSELWASDAENCARRFAIRGLEAIVARVAHAHDEWVAQKGFVIPPGRQHRRSGERREVLLGDGAARRRTARSARSRYLRVAAGRAHPRAVPV